MFPEEDLAEHPVRVAGIVRCCECSQRYLVHPSHDGVMGTIDPRWVRIECQNCGKQTLFDVLPSSPQQEETIS
jgi:hypothetical protein